MADQFPNLSPELISWIESQHVYFVGTAAQEGRVNISPKGGDSLRVVDEQTLLWLNLTGSGNESAAHVQDINRMTVMWCAFEGPPRILRVYGNVETIHPRNSAWSSCTKVLSPQLGARQYFKLHIELVQTSCGYAVPLMSYQEDRTVLQKWSEKRGPDGIAEYWADKNQLSLDGQPTGILN